MPKETCEQLGLDAAPEALATAAYEHRYAVAILFGPSRVRVYVALINLKRILLAQVRKQCFGILAQVAVGTGVKLDLDDRLPGR